MPKTKTQTKSDIVIEIDNLTKKFGGIKVLDGIDLEVRKGEVFGLLFGTLFVLAAIHYYSISGTYSYHDLLVLTYISIGMILISIFFFTRRDIEN